MSIYAAIGYAIGIISFAMILRRFRSRMIKRHIKKARNDRSQSVRGNQHD